jgi:RNA polymerase sigma factor (sigma-70 family)
MTTNDQNTPPPANAGDDATIVQLYEEARKIGRAILYDLGDDKKSRSVTDVVHSVFARYILPNREKIEALAKEPARLLGLIRTALRHRLTDYARRRGALKRPPASQRVDLESLDDLMTMGLPAFAEKHPDRVALLVKALDLLKTKDAEAFEVIELKYFVGYDFVEIARLRGVSDKTVRRAHHRGKVALERIILRMEAGS